MFINTWVKAWYIFLTYIVTATTSDIPTTNPSTETMQTTTTSEPTTLTTDEEAPTTTEEDSPTTVATYVSPADEAPTTSGN